MRVSEYLELLNRRKYYLIVGLVLGIIGGVYAVYDAEVSHRGRVTFFVSSENEGSVAAANAGDQFAQRRVNSYLALLRTDRLAELIIDDSGLNTTPPTIRKRISGTADLNTVLLTATVRHADAEVAQTITESLANVFPDYIAEVERPVDGDPTVRLELVSGPDLAEVPVRSRRVLVLWAGGGLFLGLLAGLLREVTDQRIRTTEAALAVVNAPLLGLVSEDRSAARSPFAAATDGSSVRAEQYRQIRTGLEHLRQQDRSQVIMVTSSTPAEGKSVLSANLAIATARLGRRVALIDGDLRKPTLAKMFGIEPSVGLTEVLRDGVEPEAALQDWGGIGLRVLAAGGGASTPAELLASVAMRQLMLELREVADVVIIDTPPLLPVTDATIVAPFTDGVVFAIRPNRVTRHQLEQSMRLLDQIDATLLGVVGSMVDTSSSPYGGKTYTA